MVLADLDVKTFVPKPEQHVRPWYLVDAQNKVLGRLASRVAALIRGKDNPLFTPHLDLGASVVVINAAKVRLTGGKHTKKTYYWHTLYPGSLKAISFDKLLATKPERVIEYAVRGMLPKNRLGRKLSRRLFVYAGPDHPHAAQNPKAIDI